LHLVLGRAGLNILETSRVRLLIRGDPEVPELRTESSKKAKLTAMTRATEEATTKATMKMPKVRLRVIQVTKGKKKKKVREMMNEPFR
jgi:hypothetical protein